MSSLRRGRVRLHKTVASMSGRTWGYLEGCQSNRAAGHLHLVEWWDGGAQLDKLMGPRSWPACLVGCPSCLWFFPRRNTAATADGPVSTLNRYTGKNDTLRRSRKSAGFTGPAEFPSPHAALDTSPQPRSAYWGSDGSFEVGSPSVKLLLQGPPIHLKFAVGSHMQCEGRRDTSA
jgi:hypothetical protein